MSIMLLPISVWTAPVVSATYGTLQTILPVTDAIQDLTIRLLLWIIQNNPPIVPPVWVN